MSTDRQGERVIHIESRFDVSGANRDTEMFAEFIARDAPRSFLDVGTGTGYLAIRLALAGSDVTATDISHRAKALAERNARRNGIHLSVRISDLFDDEAGTYDAIAFNPPCSARPDPRFLTVVKEAIRRIEPLERALMHHMPKHVITFRRDLIHRFIEGGSCHLNPEGRLYLLLYGHELSFLEAMPHDLVVTAHTPHALRRRNLAFARLSRRPDRPSNG
jgi:predicted RNA methylase